MSGYLFNLLDVPHSSSVDLGLGVCLVLLSIAITLSNSVLLTILWRIRARRLNTHVFVWSMGLNDLVTGVVVLPGMLPPLFTNREVTVNSVLCQILGVVTSVTVTTSVLMVMCLTVDRFVAVTFPLKYNTTCTHTRVLSVVLYCWLQAVTFSVVPLVPALKGYRFDEVLCSCLKVVGRVKRNVFSTLFNFTCMVVPILSVLIFSVCIVYNLRSNKGITGGAKQKRVREACITTLLIVAFYMLCLSPYLINYIIVAIQPNTSTGAVGIGYWKMFCLLSTYSNSLINSLVYISRSCRMRDEVKKLAEEISTRLSKTLETLF